MSTSPRDKSASPLDPRVHLSYWQEKYQGEAYYIEGYTYEDYGPAYTAGLDLIAKHPDHPYEEHESTLAHDWAVFRGDSRLDWKEASPAVRAAWERAKMHRMEG
ncbi:hypothetical protein [Ottowia thiooxydans]|uniref:hypothetical protein n=1 Tax=Ottowia thiooxydans TaxID=219182 RepID=UPI000413CCB7|nr:hypothetical protein [Ottowia thiooxydans]